MSKNTKQLKVWAVIRIYPKRIKRPTEPEICSGRIDSDCGCGNPTTDALGIYSSEYQANSAVENYSYGGSKEVVVPCTITYELPKI